MLLHSTARRRLFIKQHFPNINIFTQLNRHSIPSNLITRQCLCVQYAEIFDYVGLEAPNGLRSAKTKAWLLIEAIENLKRQVGIACALVICVHLWLMRRLIFRKD